MTNDNEMTAEFHEKAAEFHEKAASMEQQLGFMPAVVRVSAGELISGLV